LVTSIRRCTDAAWFNTTATRCEAQKINAALKNLLDDGRVVRRTEEGSGRGRKAVRFYLAEI